MAVNENVNKVVYGNSTLIDLTNDTVVPEALVYGYTAHDRSGATVTGTLELPSSSNPLPVEKGGTNANTASGARTNLDVYSKSEVTNAISQSTATLHIGGNMAGLARNDGRINLAVPYQGPVKTAVSADKTSNISGNIYGDKSLVGCTFTIQDLQISSQKVVYFNLLPSVTLSTYQNLGRVMMVDLSEPITLTLS